MADVKPGVLQYAKGAQTEMNKNANFVETESQFFTERIDLVHEIELTTGKHKHMSPRLGVMVSRSTQMIDILAIGVHPDDVELSCGGTVLKHISLGKKVGILDLTKGELGTRGTVEIRKKEASKAAKILGVEFRDTLDMKDGAFENNSEHQIEIIKKIRQYKPTIILCNAITDRHPDHGRAAQLISEACYYSGLAKIETKVDGKIQQAFRPKAVYHYIQDRHIQPDFVVDVSEFVNKKMEAIQAFSSQFYNPKSKEAETPISSRDFLQSIRSRMNDLGRNIGVQYAEGFTAERYVGVKNLFDLL